MTHISCNTAFRPSYAESLSTTHFPRLAVRAAGAFEQGAGCGETLLHFYEI